MLIQFIPILVYISNLKLRKKNDDENEFIIPNNIKKINLKFLEDDYQASIKAKDKFEDKAKTILAALAIAITMILNLSKMIEEVIANVQFPNLNYFVFLIALFSILYMLFASIMSIQVLIKENILHIVPLEERTQKESIYKAMKQNINQNLIRNNLIYAACMSIRNSVVCLLIIFILAVFPFEKENNRSLIVNSFDSEILYKNNAIDWLVNNPDKKINWNQILQFYNRNGDRELKKNIYDKKYGIVFTIGIKGETYIIYDIKSNIVEFKQN